MCERLVLDGEPGILALCAERAHHVHARVGYDQGPQVPHPDASEYRAALGAHERWWDAIWSAHARAGRATATMTPEFGPDGYLHTLPFSGAPGRESRRNQPLDGAPRARTLCQPVGCNRCAQSTFPAS